MIALLFPIQGKGWIYPQLFMEENTFDGLFRLGEQWSPPCLCFPPNCLEGTLLNRDDAELLCKVESGEFSELWGVERGEVKCDGNESVERGLLRRPSQLGDVRQGGGGNRGTVGLGKGVISAPHTPQNRHKRLPCD